MLIYLAAPIESDEDAGVEFRDQFVKTLRENPPHLGYTVYDPARAFFMGTIDSSAEEIKRANRAVIYQSTVMVALLAGCETWREIEWAVTHDIRVFGIWPRGAYNRSPVAALGVTVFDSIEDLVTALCLDE